MCLILVWNWIQRANMIAGWIVCHNHVKWLIDKIPKNGRSTVFCSCFGYILHQKYYWLIFKNQLSWKIDAAQFLCNIYVGNIEQLKNVPKTTDAGCCKTAHFNDMWLWGWGQLPQSILLDILKHHVCPLPHRAAGPRPTERKIHYTSPSLPSDRHTQLFSSVF